MRAEMMKVTLSRHGQFISVQPPVAELLALRTVGHFFTDSRRRRNKVCRCYEPLLTPRDLFSPDRRLLLWAGLEPAVRYVLKNKYEIESPLRGTVPFGLPEPLPLRMFSTCLEVGVLEWMHQHDRGLISFDRSRIDPAEVLKMIAQAYPAALIAVIGTNIRENSRICRQLRDEVPGAITAVAGDRPMSSGCIDAWPPPDDEPPRVVVSTPYGLAHLQHEHREIVICLDALAALGQMAQFVIQYCPRARTYAFIRSEECPSPRDRDWLAALFGFERCTVRSVIDRVRPVEVTWQHVGGGPGLPRTLDHVRRKKDAIWGHPVRNRRVARAARLAAGGDLPFQDGRGPNQAAPGIVVLVECLEHALNLARLLPGWGIFCGPNVVDAGLHRWQRQLLDERIARHEGAGQIVTSLAAQTMDFRFVDVVIRADGGRGLPSMATDRPESDRWNALSFYRPPTRLLIVDFDDRHHPLTFKWANARRRAYVANGWFAPGADHARERVRQFLANPLRRIK
jgi:hypothetical protein